MELAKVSRKVTDIRNTYKAADQNSAFATTSTWWPCWNRLYSTLDCLRVLVNTSDWSDNSGFTGRATNATVTSASNGRSALSADDLVERFIECSRHLGVGVLKVRSWLITGSLGSAVEAEK
jgi:hypothetical protein